MSRLPRYPPEAKATGADLNLILSILDTGSVISGNSATNSGVTGDSLVATIPNTSGSVSPDPGDPGSPATPRGFSGSYGIDNFSQSHTAYVILTWTPNPVADFVSRYDIYYHKGSDPTLYNLSVGGDVNLIRVNNLFPGNTYSFAIQAHDAANRTSLWTPEIDVNISRDTDPPAVPTGLTATGASTGIYLKWTAVGAEGLSNDLKGYQIAISLDAGVSYPFTNTTGPGSDYFWAPTAASLGTVYFKVASVDWTGNISDYSAPASAAMGTIFGPITINPGPLTVITGGIGIDSTSAQSSTLSINNVAFLWSNVVAANSFQRYGLGYGMYWNIASANYQIVDTTFTQSSFSDDNGVFRWNINQGALTNPQTYAAWNALATRMTLDPTSLSLVGTKLVFTAATSKIVPGGTSLSHRNNADNADNLLITDAGAATFRSSIAMTGALSGATTGAFSGRVSTTGLDASSSGSGASAAINFGAANPYLNSSSYITIPGGAYFNSGTVYTEAAFMARGGIQNDTGSGNPILQIPNGINTGAITSAAITASGDIRTYRAGATTTGVIYFSQSADRYLYYDGTNYFLNAGGLSIGGAFTNATTGGFSGIVTASGLTLSSTNSRIIPGATDLSLRNNANSADNLLITDAGTVTVRANLKMATAAGKIIPGATSLTFRNNGDNADNVSITDAGVFTLRDKLVFSSATSRMLPGATSHSWRNNADSADNLLISDAGDMTGRTKLTMPGPLTLSTAASKIVPGATSLSLRNNADSADNLILTDAGLATYRNAIKVPPSAAGTVAATSYGTLPVKIEEATPTGTTFTFPSSGSLPTGFRHLLIEATARTDRAANLIEELGLRFNGDSTSGNYMDERLNAQGTTMTLQDSGATARTSIRNWFTQGATSLSTAYSTHRIWIPMYNSTHNFKMVRIETTYYNNLIFAVAAKFNVDTLGGFWQSNVAITSLTIFTINSSNFVTDTTWTLYGIP